MMFGFLLFAAHHHSSDGSEAVITVVLGVVAAFVSVIVVMSKADNTNWKNGRPYCPKCGRQISLKVSRPLCRSCGYNLVQSPSHQESASVVMTPIPPAEQLRRKQEEERERQRLAEELRVIKEEKEREAEARREARQIAQLQKTAKRKAVIEANGGYTDLQLFGFGILIAAGPVFIIGLFVYFNR